MKNLIGIILGLVLALMVAAPSAGHDVDDVVANTINYVFIIEATNTHTESMSYGTGFLVTPTVLVTAYHVIEGMDSITLIDSTSKEYEGHFLGMDIKNDIAYLRVNGSAFTSFLSLSADESILSRGKEVITIGHPLGLFYTVTKGIISSKGFLEESGDLHVQYDATSYAGSSGGPLILVETGEVIGVVCSGTYGPDGEKLANYNFAPYSQTIVDYLESLEE
jgi:S1-C subfamily serine protease